MPLKLDLSTYGANNSPEIPTRGEQTVLPEILVYASAIMRGIGHGVTNVATAVRDFAIYPIGDVYTLLSLATHPDFSELDSLMAHHPDFYQGLQERMESRANTLYHLSLLAYDAAIISAHHDKQNPDLQEFHTLISRHPDSYREAEVRMSQRAEGWSNQYTQFMQSSGPQKVELVSEVAISLLAPGTLVKSLKIVSTGVNNIRAFGMFSHPPKFYPVSSEPFLMPQFRLLTIEDIKATQGMIDCIWVITKENQLLIAPTELSTFFRPVELKFVSQQLRPDYLARLSRCDWVYASGEAFFSEGRLIGVFNDTKHYLSGGEYLETLIAKAFEMKGFQKNSYKMQGFDGLGKTVPRKPHFETPSLKRPETISLSAIGILSTPQSTYEVEGLDKELSRFLNFAKNLKKASQLQGDHPPTQLPSSASLSVRSADTSSTFAQHFRAHFLSGGEGPNLDHVASDLKFFSQKALSSTRLLEASHPQSLVSDVTKSSIKVTPVLSRRPTSEKQLTVIPSEISPPIVKPNSQSTFASIDRSLDDLHARYSAKSSYEQRMQHIFHLTQTSGSISQVAPTRINPSLSYFKPMIESTNAISASLQTSISTMTLRGAK